MSMNKKEIAEKIGKDLKTLYNWERTNPELYKALFNYYNGGNGGTKYNEFVELFQKLSETEQEYIKAEIKMLISRKEI